jgi:hypothetical protein
MKHFETKKQAKEFLDKTNQSGLKIFQKVIGQKNRMKKPFVVCTEFEFLNLY